MNAIYQTNDHIEFTNSEPVQRAWLVPAFSTVLLTLALALGYSLWDNHDQKEAIVQKDNAYASNLVEKDTLQSLLNNAYMKFDLLKTISVNKDSTISNQEIEIVNIRSTIQSVMSVLNTSQSRYAELTQLVSKLNTNIEDYKNNVIALNEQKPKPAEQNTFVATEKKDEVERAEAVNVTPVENTDMSNAGSTLYATNFRNTGIIQGKKNKLKATDRARRADELHICFDLAENRRTSSGKEDIYVAIISPSGNLLTEEGTIAGNLPAKSSKSLSFSRKLEVEYIEGQQQKISFNWKPNAKFEDGEYKINVFNKGYKIGQSSYMLKKEGVFN